VETYDKLKEVIQGKSTPDGLSDIQQNERYWTSYVALFENHDEQRLASPNLLVHQKRKTFDGCFHNNKLSSPQWFILGRKWVKLVMKMEVSERILELQFWLCSAKSSTLDE
jgi:hypothetical protein